MWDLKLMKRLRALHGVRAVEIDQCAFGCQHKKPTLVLTNAPWIQTTKCEDAPPHTHVPLVGKVWSYETGKMEWYTSEAAEYPAGMCEAWAQNWAEFLSDNEDAEKKTTEDAQHMVKVGRHGNALSLASNAPLQEPK